MQVLGTFITEFGQGRLRCNRMFSDYETARVVADQLAAIAAHYGFEGWLVRRGGGGEGHKGCFGGTHLGAQRIGGGGG